jgi:glutaredoxin
VKLFHRRTSAPTDPGPERGSDHGAAPRVTLIGKPGCHLCDDARAVVERVAAELAVDWIELDITADAALAERYWEQIPVVLVDGDQHDFWRVDEARLRTALL